MRKDRIGIVLVNKEVANLIYKMIIKFDEIGEVLGGQFIHIQLPNAEHVLRRPFCICDFSIENNTITIVYALVGAGTQILSQIKVGDKLKAMFPLGNGFANNGYKRIVLLGGGMGTAVLPAVARQMNNVDCYSYIGFANKTKVVLEEELKCLSKELTVATDDGSYGKKGYAINFVKEDLDRIKPDAIFCCGPEVMYKAIKKSLEGIDVPVYISLEQRMGCGIGACLVCNCKIKKNGEETYLRVCKDGPVFSLDEVLL